MNPKWKACTWFGSNAFEDKDGIGGFYSESSQDTSDDKNYINEAYIPAKPSVS